MISQQYLKSLTGTHMSKKKRIFFETEEVVRKTRRGYIDLEMDYFQFYNAAFHHLASLSNNCAKDFVLWIMGRVNDDNEFTYSKLIYQDFSDALSKIERPKTYTENTLHVAIRELVDCGILIKMGRAHYKVNPKLFWSEDTSRRIETIRQLESNSKAMAPVIQGIPLDESAIQVEPEQETIEEKEVEEKVVVTEVVTEEEDDPLKY
jgi:hypothetical protein